MRKVSSAFENQCVTNGVSLDYTPKAVEKAFSALNESARMLKKQCQERMQHNPFFAMRLDAFIQKNEIYIAHTAQFKGCTSVPHEVLKCFRKAFHKQTQLLQENALDFNLAPAFAFDSATALLYRANYVKFCETYGAVAKGLQSFKEQAELALTTLPAVNNSDTEESRKPIFHFVERSSKLIDQFNTLCAATDYIPEDLLNCKKRLIDKREEASSELAKQLENKLLPYVTRKSAQFTTFTT